MARNPTPIVAKRRERVARLTVRGLTTREIAAAIGGGNDPIVNPRGGNPYSHKTIWEDIVWLEAEWLERANQDIGRRKARYMAELEDVKRLAYSTGDVGGVIRSIRLQAELDGLLTKDDGQSVGGRVIVEVVDDWKGTPSTVSQWSAGGGGRSETLQLGSGRPPVAQDDDGDEGGSSNGRGR